MISGEVEILVREASRPPEPVLTGGVGRPIKPRALSSAKRLQAGHLNDCKVLPGILVPGKDNAFQFDALPSRNQNGGLDVCLKFIRSLSFFKTIVMRESVCRDFLTWTGLNLFKETEAEIVRVVSLVLPNLVEIAVI